MKTPIADFVKNYTDSKVSRFHMPGHKGKAILGCEPVDITEIMGADVLGEAQGIIGESEENATTLFGTGHSFYVTQGSTTAICAMLALVKVAEGRTTVLAARNVHKAFVNACALLDMDVDWLMPEVCSNILECEITAEMVEIKLKNSPKPSAVYLTSPDYLGNIQNIQGISKVCKKYGVPLLVDNAHGAYLKFLEKSLHPIDLGADMCCDSAHKTLPVLTGGGYLHISKDAPKKFIENARGKLGMFSSTSPSYLILQSLDLCNAYLAGCYRTELSECIKCTDAIKAFLTEKGFALEKGEPLKITVNARKSGYSGSELAELLRRSGVEPEFCDNDFLVLMATPQNSHKDFERLTKAFSQIGIRPMSKSKFVPLNKPVAKMTIRDAVFAESEMVRAENAIGRICAELTVSCPPAVPVVVCGEEITEEAAAIFDYYGTDKVKVVK